MTRLQTGLLVFLGLLAGAAIGYKLAPRPAAVVLGLPPDIDEIVVTDNEKAAIRTKKTTQVYRIELTVPIDEGQWTDFKTKVNAGSFAAAKLILLDNIAMSNRSTKTMAVVNAVFDVPAGDVPDVDYDLLEDYVHKKAGGIVLEPKFRMELNVPISDATDWGNLENAAEGKPGADKKTRACLAWKHVPNPKKTAGPKDILNKALNVDLDTANCP